MSSPLAWNPAVGGISVRMVTHTIPTSAKIHYVSDWKSFRMQFRIVPSATTPRGCSQERAEMVHVPAGGPALALCLAVGGTLPLRPAAFLNTNHHERPAAFLAQSRVLLGRSSSPLRCTHKRAAMRCRSRMARPRPRWLFLAATAGGDGEVDEVEDSAAMDDDDYVPTETLLDDPSHIERILAAMAKLAPEVTSLEDCVFKAAVNHHTALRTSNIVRALKFYSLLGMKEVVRFRAESARCAFLEGAGMRLELIEVPASMQPEDKAPDLATDMRSTGLNHVAFDVGPAIEARGLDGLKGFLSDLNQQSEEAFGMSVRLAVSPYEQRIGQDVFDIAFITDADGVLLELLHNKLTLDVHMPQAW